MKKFGVLLMLVAATAIVTAQRGGRGQAPAPAAQAPKEYPPTAEQRSQIDAKLADLTKQIQALEAKKTDPKLLADVIIFQRAAQYILRYPEEFNYGPNYAAETISALDMGLERAKELASGGTSWASKKGNVVRGYISSVDGTVQPYGVTIPDSYDGTKPVRLDVWLHGTQTQLNEVRFINQQSKSHTDGTNDPTPTDFIQVDVFGRMNNSYRYAGETDVMEAIASVESRYKIDPARIIVRGHSMGGQAWHLGLQHPGYFAALEASAGYVDTHEYAGNRLPKEGLTPWQETTLHIYDSQDYAQNAYDIITVGYGGENDAQLRASVKMREALTKLGYKITEKDKYTFTTDLPHALFLVGPNTGHAWEPNKKKESEAFLRAALDQTGAKAPNHLKYVTYTARWNQCWWLNVDSLEQTYERAEVDATRTDDMKKYTVTTKNVERLGFTGPAASYTIDGQTLNGGANAWFEKANGKWAPASAKPTGLRKVHGLQGPIDDAFFSSFIAVRGTGQPWNAAAQAYADKRLNDLKVDFSKWMRGDIRIKDDKDITAADIANSNLIVFGDPGSNSILAKALPKLPIEWTKTELKVNGQSYPSAENQVALVYPNPLNPQHYIVLNSGHTFSIHRILAQTESVFFPRLGDWGVVSTDISNPEVLKPTGTIKASGFFDENWKLKKTASN